MIYQGKKIAFPAQTKISFTKLIERLSHEHTLGNKKSSEMAALLTRCDKNSDLLNGLGEEEFDIENPLLKQLCSTLFPEALRDNEIKGIIPPFEFRPFYLSNRFEKILKASGEDFSFELNNFDADKMYIFGCVSILHFYYGYPFIVALPNLVNIAVSKGGKEKTYRLVMNGDMLEIEPTENAKTIIEQDWLDLLNDFDNIDLWKDKFPPNSWVMKGIGIVNLIDVTNDQSIVNIKSQLLTGPLRNLQDLLPELEQLLNVDKLSIGFIGHDQQAFSTDITGFKSLIINNDTALDFKQNMCAPSYEKLIVQEKPIVITDVGKWNASPSCSTVSLMVEKAEARSYIIMPVKYNDELLGYLELASSKPYALNGASLLKMDVLLPTLGMAIKRSRIEFQNRVEAIIQQKCTTIHSSVKWRFEDESVKYIDRMDNLDEETEFSDIIFSDVYPMYGQLDINSSTKKRNEAVQADLQNQLEIVNALLNLVWDDTKLPIQEEILFRLHNYQSDLQNGFVASTEQSIIYFLIQEIHPLLLQIKEQAAKPIIEIDNYFDLLQPELQTLYDKRRKFDKHVALVNQTLARRLDKKQIQAQKMYPHYFERYKTDGVEYNMYIGQSIARSKDFSIIHLQNLQLWQLMVTCELEQEYHRMKNRLSLDLDIASLILVYSSPISIHFRMDEKRFDVAGAYNARYEIVKKRIDKAHIKNSDERITSPGKIAIIYSNEQDAVFYKRYIAFLENKGLLEKDTIEMLDVEDLPSISGLKAIRVAIDFSQSH